MDSNLISNEKKGARDFRVNFYFNCDRQGYLLINKIAVTSTIRIPTKQKITDYF